MTTAEKVRENRIRRMAKRQGLELCKSRSRDPLALNYGRWVLVDPRRSVTVAGGDYFAGEFRATLEEAETWLRTGRRVMVSAA